MYSFSTFCDGFMVQSTKIMTTKFLHLWFLLFDCFVCSQNLTCLKCLPGKGHYTSEVQDIIN